PAALIAVNQAPRDLTRHRVERAVPSAAQQQPATAVVARGSDLGRKEILGEKQVLVAVAVEVGHSRVERRSELCLGGKRSGLERGTTVEEDLMVQRRRFEPLRTLQRTGQDVLERGVRVRGVGPRRK